MSQAAVGATEAGGQLFLRKSNSPNLKPSLSHANKLSGHSCGLIVHGVYCQVQGEFRAMCQLKGKVMHVDCGGGIWSGKLWLVQCQILGERQPWVC